ncbi:notch-regulated ankyrin repeat-containing -like [Brachionus plicatilis]|uniref:Notch-regulated ankyrin repeat-containing-like n=1 Tax=Brachionus plicatilis TaxID=10195 RepID=A0A3M7P802_BRAPC|nr:notch-regulated ankyrin repeat-containing -like [Brachionus plicatilis]
MIDFTRVAKLRDDLNVAVESSDAKRLRQILTSAYVNLNFVDKEGQTPLHRSCSRGNLEICKILVEYGASQGIRNSIGWYPIHLASYHGYTDIVKFLLDETNFKKESLINVYESCEEKSRSCCKNLFPVYRQRAESNEESSDEEDSDDDSEQDYEDLVYGLEIQSNADDLIKNLNENDYADLISIQNLELNSDDFLF